MNRIFAGCTRVRAYYYSEILHVSNLSDGVRNTPLRVIYSFRM